MHFDLSFFRSVCNSRISLALLALLFCVGCGRGPTTPVGNAPEEPLPEVTVSSGEEFTPVAAVNATDAGSRSAPTVESDLTAGIPGHGPLTLLKVQEWLNDAAHHEPLEFTLPLGLAGAGNQDPGMDSNPLTRAKIELGRQLYFDKRLSADATVSCADCHHPDEGFSRHTQFGVGIQSQTGNRNSPVSYNRIVSGPQFWDGRAGSLEEQAVGPIANPIEMGNTHENAVRTVAQNPVYQAQFKKIFPTDGVTIDNIGRAIASFERVIVTGPSLFDYNEIVRNLESQYDSEEIAALEQDDPETFARYQMAKENSREMSDSAKRGRELFFGERGGCTACHAGANFTDEQYHNLGVGMNATQPDLGRFIVTKQDKDRGAFKTPTVRNVVFSAPYMHDGSQKTLEEVVDWYEKGGHPNPHLSDKVKKLKLSAQDKGDLVAFMHALTGSFPKIETGRLPADR